MRHIDITPAEVLMAMVDNRLATNHNSHAGFRDFKTRLPMDAVGAFNDAVDMRGMSRAAYTRRATLAFVAYDLHLPLADLLENEPPTRLITQFDLHDIKSEAGLGHGLWNIRGLS